MLVLHLEFQNNHFGLGVAGEIVIGSPLVASGYRGLPEVTAKNDQRKDMGNRGLASRTRSSTR